MAAFVGRNKQLRIFACFRVAAAALGTVFATAEELPPVEWAQGSYAGGSAENFAPLGDMDIAWAPDFRDTVDLSDGDLMDWYNSPIPTGKNVTPHNMISWIHGEKGGITDWHMVMMAAADKDYLYLAFEFVDPDFACTTDAEACNGDTLRLEMDFAGKLKETLEQDPDRMADKANVTYSIGCTASSSP